MENASLVATSSQNSARTASQALIAKYDKYVSIKGEKYVFSAPAGAPQADKAEILSAVATANKSVSASIGTFAPSRGAQFFSSTTAHGGTNFHWWGYTIWLDKWATGRLEALVATGSGASWVAAELTSWTGIGGLGAGAIAALLAATGGVIWLFDWNNNAINFECLYVGESWVWAR